MRIGRRKKKELGYWNIGFELYGSPMVMPRYNYLYPRIELYCFKLTNLPKEGETVDSLYYKGFWLRYGIDILLTIRTRIVPLRLPIRFQGQWRWIHIKRIIHYPISLKIKRGY